MTPATLSAAPTAVVYRAAWHRIYSNHTRYLPPKPWTLHIRDRHGVRTVETHAPTLHELRNWMDGMVRDNHRNNDYRLTVRKWNRKWTIHEYLPGWHNTIQLPGSGVLTILNTLRLQIHRRLR